jgi:hypothetical protein
MAALGYAASKMPEAALYAVGRSLRTGVRVLARQESRQDLRMEVEWLVDDYVGAARDFAGVIRGSADEFRRAFRHIRARCR